MSTTGSTLMDFTRETNTIVMDAVAANNRRQIAFVKNFWGIVSRPYPGNDLKINVAETFGRVENVLDLTMADLETTSKATLELAENVMSQASKAREESIVAARTFAKNGVTSMKHALETTEERLDTLSKRLEETIDEVAVTSKKATKAS